MPHNDRVPQPVFKAAAETGFYIARTPVMMEGRIELLQYFQQQAVCNTYHRYGNLGERTHLPLKPRMDASCTENI
ncbi:MAG: hypothetical protein U5R06_15275 [candidate division KSB1 bacterium]|nr:hypothetical protein [candidate division KSB1 bacterium]